MGNDPCCGLEGKISFKSENVNNNLNKANIILIKEKNFIKEREIIFEEVENNKNLEKFLNIIERIYNDIDILKNKDITYLIRNAMKSILQKIFKKKEDINLQLKKMDDIIEDSKNLIKIKRFIDIFILIYSNKEKIGEEKIKHFIGYINDAIDHIEKLDKNEKNFFIEYIKNIYLYKNNIKSEKSLIEEDASQKENSNNNEYKKNSNIKENLFDSKEIDEIIKRKLTNSNYSENSKNQILKLEDEIQQYKNKIKEIELKKNEIEITFIDENKNKKSTKVQMNEKVNPEEIVKYLFTYFPELKNKTIQNIEINGGESQLDGYNESDNCFTHCNTFK